MEDYKLLNQKIRNSISNICSATRERTIQDILAAVLNAKTRVILSLKDNPSIEIDLIWRHFFIEVKLNDKYYSGISQICVQKFIYENSNNILIHANKNINKNFINALQKLSNMIKFYCILIDTKKKKIIEIVPNDQT